MQLESLKERNIRLNNRLLVARITAMQEAAATTIGLNHETAIITKTTESLEPSASEITDINCESSPKHVSCVPATTEQPSQPHFNCTNHNGLELLVSKDDRDPNDGRETNLFKHGFREKSKSAIVRRRSSKSGGVISRSSLIRCKSNTEGGISEGIVMRPLLNSIWPCAIDDADYCKDHQRKSASSDPIILSLNSAESSIPLKREAKDCDANIQTSHSLLLNRENSTQTSNIDRFLSTFTTQDPARGNRKMSLVVPGRGGRRRRSSDDSEVGRPVFLSHFSLSRLDLVTRSKNLHDPNCRGTTDSARLCYSLENLSDLQRNVATAQEMMEETQSNPRPTPKLRVIRDPQKVRDFVLDNLIERARPLGTEVIV